MSAFLYPQQNRFRELSDISGIWKFRFDPQGEGRTSGWKDGLTDTIDMAVPASYNDIFTDKALRDHGGDVWYETEIVVPDAWLDRDIYVRFGSATHAATAWLNGVELVSHQGGYMPFWGKLNDALDPSGRNRLVVVVNNELGKTTLPCGAVKQHEDGTKEVIPWFDFFNYSGLHRPVKVLALPRTRVDDVTVVNQAGKVKRRGRSLGRRASFKKAYVRLAAGSEIDFLGAE